MQSTKQEQNAVKRAASLSGKTYQGCSAQKTMPSAAFWERFPEKIANCNHQGGKWKNTGCVFGPKRAIAWRVLDAQYFGVAQRRRRVFVVASAREGFDPAEILFESDGVRRDTPPRREAGQSTTHDVGESTKATGSHWDSIANPHPALTQSHNTGGIGASNQEVFSQRGSGLVPHGYRMTAFGEYADDETVSTMKARDCKGATDLVVHGTQDPCVQKDLAFALGRNRGQENVVYTCATKQQAMTCEANLASTLGANDFKEPQAVSFGIPGNWIGRKPENGGNAVEPMHDISPCQTTTDRYAVAYNFAVRRLTPIECERLQGFPDNWTQIPWRNKPVDQCPDGPRYKAIGNSKAVPVVHWLGRRINQWLINQESEDHGI